jgi:rod shape-determining protein MreC
VIAIGPTQDFAWTVTIDAGSRDGLGVDMTVVNGSGLVGRVVSVGETTATVALLIDATTSLGGRIAQSQEIGIVSGTGAQYELQMQILDPLAPVDAGTAVVTFGSEGGRPYVPGVPIGVVTEVKGSPGQLARIAVVRPYVDMSTLDLVGVITEPPRVDPRDSVLPSAAPVPSPSAS